MEIKKGTKLGAKEHAFILVSNEKEITQSIFEAKELAFIKQKIKKEEKFISFQRLDQHFVVAIVDGNKDFKANQETRKVAAKMIDYANSNQLNEISIIANENIAIPFLEGALLSSYQFLKYKSEKKNNTLTSIKVIGKVSKAKIDEVTAIACATNAAKDLVNEPVSFLTAVQLSKEIKRLSKEFGFKAEVFSKSKIEALKMGGLLAVNKGSIDPPTFSILEWKPTKAKNKKPIVLVGKGVVYDTGGLSLKPTPNSMDFMKSDMGGAAAVIGAMCAISKNKLPYHVIALVPATDNRPGGAAYAPGDVITMHNKKTVEVLNTDAEGRMIMADALSYAQKYKPELVLDAATLTGAAAMAIGHYGVVAMGNTEEQTMNKLKESGKNVYERVVEFPFWDEYNEQLKSDIADITNLGNGAGGAITAGKFLEHFTDYPYIHIDIAGPGWMKAKVDYVSKGASGVGVRLFYDFIKNY